MSQATRQMRMPLLLPQDREISRGRLWTVRLIIAALVLGSLFQQTSVAGAVGGLVAQAILYWLLLRAFSESREGEA